MTVDELTLTERVSRAYDTLRGSNRPDVWIHVRAEADALADAAIVEQRIRAGEPQPLAGLVFAAKGNIDIAGVRTTAACPSYGEIAEQDATAVSLLRDAGAVLLGSTNLDQFATGLVGSRSPHGAVAHAFRPEKISGGSSSGSAVAVALGIVDFALGTDTAGSGRVPAAFHGIVGIKPTRGLVSAAGVVPACRTLDCVTVLAPDVDVAEHALSTMAGFDPRDSLSRVAPPGPEHTELRRIGIPLPGQLGELAPGWAEAFEQAVTRLGSIGLTAVAVDISRFLAVAQSLYDGAFVAERYTAVGAFVDAHRDEVDPTVGAIIASARDIPAHRLFADLEVLDGHRAHSAAVFSAIDALLLPTTVEHPTLNDVATEPLAVNARLGRFTNFANLLDLAAVAVPAGKAGADDFGVQFIGPAFSDAALATLARRFLAAGRP